MTKKPANPVEAHQQQTIAQSTHAPMHHDHTEHAEHKDHKDEAVSRTVTEAEKLPHVEPTEHKKAKPS